jgi:hypothetical protein
MQLNDVQCYVIAHTDNLSEIFDVEKCFRFRIRCYEFIDDDDDYDDGNDIFAQLHLIRCLT